MRYSQKREVILQDIFDLRQELQADINTIRGDISLAQGAVERWDTLMDKYTDYYTNYSTKELQSIRREMLNIRSLKTSTPEGAKMYHDIFTPILEDFQQHSSVWSKAVEKVFKRFVEQIPFMGTARYKYEVLQAITEAKNVRHTNIAAENLRTAYDEALKKAGNDDEDKLMAEFIRIFHDKQGVRKEVLKRREGN